MIYVNTQFCNAITPHGKELTQMAIENPTWVGTFSKELAADIRTNGTMAVPGIVRFYAKWGGQRT